MSHILHIIANCTGRKRAEVPDLFCLRTVPPGTLEQRVSWWCARLKQPAEKTVRAEDLYAGDHWTAVKRLRPLAEQLGFKPFIWIISAGYGLVSASACIHPYSATFSGAHPDGVRTFVTEKKSRRNLLQEWWKVLTSSQCVNGKGPRSLTDLAKSGRRDYYLVVTSPDYLLAVGNDLQNAVNRHLSPDRLLIVSSGDGQDDPLSQYLIPSSARLQSRVGGARAALNARVASLVLKKIATYGFNADALRKDIRTVAARSPKQPTYERLRRDDDEIKLFIRKRLSQQTRASFSSLLREFRDGGQACEAGRFKSLYYEVKEILPQA